MDASSRPASSAGNNVPARRPFTRVVAIPTPDAAVIQTSSSRSPGAAVEAVSPPVRTDQITDAADIDDDAVYSSGAASGRGSAGTSGAPWPPAAISRLRKSATTAVLPVSSASKAAIASCKRVPAVGRWRRVCPWQPMARIVTVR